MPRSPSSQTKREPASRELFTLCSGTPLALTLPHTSSLFVQMVRRLERKIDERLRSTVNRIRQVDEFREDEVLYVGHQVHWPTHDKGRFVLQGRFNSFSYLIVSVPRHR